MGQKQQNIFLGCLFIVLIITLMALFFSLKISKTGRAYEQAGSKVYIRAYMSIAKSDNLSIIDFGNLSSLPAWQNATANYNASDQTTLYSVDVLDSNVDVDFCIRATRLNTSSGAEIPLNNYKWSNSTINDPNNPPRYGRPITLSYVDSDKGVPEGSSSYYRFWLAIDAAQDPGLYNNTVYFLGVPEGESCT